MTKFNSKKIEKMSVLRRKKFGRIDSRLVSRNQYFKLIRPFFWYSLFFYLSNLFSALFVGGQLKNWSRPKKRNLNWFELVTLRTSYRLHLFLRAIQWNLPICKCCQIVILYIHFMFDEISWVCKSISFSWYQKVSKLSNY